MAGVALSCGVLVMNAQRPELLLCHATGTARWDIPKGGAEPGETPLQTAVRETIEETGLALDGAALLDLGRMAYLPAKDLHLYAALTERIDANACVCSSRFMDAHGRERPEMDRFAWVPFGELAQRCGAHMQAVLTVRLDLHSVRQRLLAGLAGAAPPAM